MSGSLWELMLAMEATKRQNKRERDAIEAARQGH